MPTPFLSYPVGPTGAPVARTLPAQLADDVNVKDYGAVGDGSTNDAAAIQAAFNAAFGTVGAPHGITNRFLNKRVIFPAGRYMTNTTLEIPSLHGGFLIGAGNGSTRLIYNGAVAGGGSNLTKLIHTNGFKQCRVEGISFESTGANTIDNATVAFDMNWDGTGEVGSAHNTFVDCAFLNATYGLLIGNDQFQSDTTLVVGCKFDNCYYALLATNFNALGSGVFSCNFSNNHSAILMTSGVMGIISGCTFSGGSSEDSNETGDIVSQTGTPVTILNCTSTSPHFITLPGLGEHYVVGCFHNSATPGYFLRLGGTFLVVENCRSTNGYLNGGVLFANNLVFDNPDWTHNPTLISEWKTATPLTFATIPGGGNSGFWREGLTLSITDATTAVWGANVTTGGGSNKVWIRWNGTNWTVVGA